MKKKVHKIKVFHSKKRAHNREKSSTEKVVGKMYSSSHAKVSGRVPTWIPRFDSLIGNGFTKNSTNLVVGDSGSGKSIFATQFLVEAMRKGEPCLYVTFEEKKAQFYENMKSLGWNLEEFERKGLFTFLEYTPIKVKTMLEEGGGAIESVILKNKVSRIIIDSITSFALLFEDEFSKREAALALFSMIRDWDCTSLITLEENPLDVDKTTSRALEFEVDSIIRLYHARGKQERQRYLEILKMRGTNHSKKVYSFDIGKNGIIMKKSVPFNVVE
jgi:circadian clock protein KaiC